MRAKKRAAGRPPLPKGEAKGEVITLRITKAERAEIELAAGRAGKPVTQWARETLIAATGP